MIQRQLGSILVEVSVDSNDLEDENRDEILECDWLLYTATLFGCGPLMLLLLFS
jgi:hypothetical protein